MKDVYYFANQVYQYGHAKPIYDKTGGTFIVNKLNSAARFKYYLRFTEKKDPGFLGAPRVIRKPKNEVYDFVVSTITLQHICVHEIRYNILKDIFRIMKPEGIFSLQVGYDKKGNHVGYYENYYDAKVTNSRCDFAVEDENYMIKDFI